MMMNVSGSTQATQLVQDAASEEESGEYSEEFRPLAHQKVHSHHRNNLSILVTSALIFVALSAVGIAFTAFFAQADRSSARLAATDMAKEVGEWFAHELASAILPLFSLAQFATELEMFEALPVQIGQAYAKESLPFLPPTAAGSLFNPRRNITGVCDHPPLVKRFTEIAQAIKRNSRMEGILHNLQLSPQGVVCLLHPINNTEDFVDDELSFLDSSGVWGLDLLNDPRHQYIARASLKNTSIGIAGPRPLTQCPQCGLYFIARLPIVDSSHNITVEGVPYPRWGFATALINWDRLIGRGEVNERFAQRGMEFQLTRTDRIFEQKSTTYSKVDVVLASSADFGRKAALGRTSTALQTTNNEWIMTVEYDTGANYEGIVIALTLAVALCIAWLVYTVLLQRQRHSDMLAHTATQHAKVSIERKMTSYFAHELRNPLSAIDSALVSLQDNDKKSNDDEALIESMALCCSFMTNIMENLLDVRKIEEGQIVLREDIMSISMLLHDVQKMTKPSAKPGVEVVVECDTSSQCGRGDFVVADTHRLVQILTNIATNAAKYTLNGSITLAARWIVVQNKDMIQLECRDTGPGIPVNEQASLFQPFTTRGGAPGTGLGLAIAKQMVELMKGTICFVSDPTVRPGTQCFVTLPLRVPEKAPCNNDAKEQAPIEKQAMFTQPLKFLLVDDITMNRTLLKRRLQKSIAPNCVVHEANTGEEAIARCKVETYDVIVMDHYMTNAGGVMLGTDAIIALRRAGTKSVVFGCSGNNLDEKFRNAGADGIWKKPLPSNDEILRQLRDVEDRFATQSTFAEL